MLDTLTFYNSLPRKRAAAGALFLNEQNEILIVKPTYREQWLLPGGSLEEDESPRLGCIREVQEELGLTLPISQLLCIDYVPRRGDINESLIFVFFGGILNSSTINQFQLPTDELSDYRFLPLKQALSLISYATAKRLPHCLEALNNQSTIYLEYGEPV